MRSIVLDGAEHGGTIKKPSDEPRSTACHHAREHMYEHQHIVDTFSRLAVPIRLREPISRAAYDDVIALLSRLKEEFSDREALPKELVLLLVSFYPELLGAAAARTSPDEQKLVERWAEAILNGIQAIVSDV